MYSLHWLLTQYEFLIFHTYYRSFIFCFFEGGTLNLNIFSPTWECVKHGTLEYVCMRRKSVYEMSWEKIWMHILECCWECLSLSRGWVKSTVTEIQSCASCHLICQCGGNTHLWESALSVFGVDFLTHLLRVPIRLIQLLITVRRSIF